MNFHDFAKLMRARWIAVAATTLLFTFGAVLVTMLTTPLYEAETRLFVSTTANTSVTDSYQGNRLSLDRVLSYTELIKGETLAQRTIDKLGLDMSAATLQERVTATAKRDTVLIDVAVLDESPVRARDIANALSDQFVAMVRELETPRPGAQPDGRVIVEQRAAIPPAPVVPNPTRNIAGGMLLGLAAGVALAFLLDMADNTVKDRETLDSITDVGLVGTIPVDKVLQQQPGLAFEGNNSGVAEAFRKLRTNLQFLAVDNPPRVIVVTSSGPSEGKTTTTINLALALAEGDNNVVLVDGDMRRPSVSNYLGLIGTVGFSTVLSGSATIDEVLQTTIFPRLTVLAAGATPPNPSELLGSLAAMKLLGELRERFDFVVIDSAPLLAVTDGAVLAANSDGAFIIARFGHTKREQLTHAVETLRSVGAVLLGSILTLTPPRKGGYYGRYAYYGDTPSESKKHSEQSGKVSAPTEGTARLEPVDHVAESADSKSADDETPIT